MQVQIRVAESGHSYHYSNLTAVHSLMQYIRKNLKIELEDQKIIMKSGQILKSSMSLQSLQDLMKKTLSSNFQSPPSTIKQIKQIECLYVYDQKQLLKPIQYKIFNQEMCLKLLREKYKQMALLGQNSYELKNFNERLIEKSINTSLESINRRLNTPFEDISQRYSNFFQSLNERNFTKNQIDTLLDFIQNQDKARKLLIRNIQFLFDRITRKKLISLNQKINKEIEKENQMKLKQSSSFFSNSKSSQSNEGLINLTTKLKLLQLKSNKCYEKLKQSKKEVGKEKFMEQEKIATNIDKKITSIQKQYDQNVKIIKALFDQFCQEILKVNLLMSKSKEKDNKDLLKNLLNIHYKINDFQKKVQENIKEFRGMFLQLSKIHMKGESISIKQVFAIYIELIRTYEELDEQIKKVEKDFKSFKEEKSLTVSLSEFSQGKNVNLPLKKSVRSPKKEEKKSDYQQSSVSKEPQSNMPKINSPIKNKIGKNNMKLFNQQLSSRSLQAALKEDKQLSRRLCFNQRLEAIVRYCSDICEKEQQLRRNFRNSKDFQENKIDLLGVLNVPSIEIDYNETTDIQLTHFYKQRMGQCSIKLQTQMDWEYQLVECINSVNKTLTAYLASKSNTSEKERNIQKILTILSDTFYKMMKKKIQKEIQRTTKIITEQIENKKNEEIQKLIKTNQELNKKLKQFENHSECETDRIKLNKGFKIGQLNVEQETQNSENGEQKTINIKDISQIIQLEQENINLKQKIKNLQQQLLTYQQDVDQTTQKLIESYEESHAEQLLKLNQEMNIQKDKVAFLSKQNANLNKQIKEIKGQHQKAKKNLIKQVETGQTLWKEIQELSDMKQYYQKQFTQLKNLLADKEVAIIKLQKQIQSINNETISNKERQSQQEEGPVHECQFKQEVIILRQDKQSLQQEIQALDRQLKEILFKQTQDYQTQTQQTYSPSQTFIPFAANYQSDKNTNQFENKETSKITQNNFIQNQQYNKIIQFQTKPANMNYFESKQGHFEVQNQAVSKYYIASNGQQWMNNFCGFSSLSIGKSIQEGMCHMFLPFSGDIYIGVTANQNIKNFSHYQESIPQSETYSKNTQPIYVLDIKEFNHKTVQLIRQCSLVLGIKIEKKSDVSVGNKVMVSGKIQFALGFEDQDMTIKNYSHFLHQ